MHDQVERDRGITVKAQTASMLHDGHLLNLIDTPGHVDFSYEVRGLVFRNPRPPFPVRWRLKPLLSLDQLQNVYAC